MKNNSGLTPPPYEDVTEGPGVMLSAEGAAMLATRYGFAVERTRGQRVLEIGCGSGVGLGWIAQGASMVAGGDISSHLLRKAAEHYGRRVELARMSADELPFASACFDAVLLMEASYYLPNFTRVVDEVRRVLLPGGRFLMANANPERPDFIRSPHSTHYHSADELRRILASAGFNVNIGAAFPVGPVSGGLLAQAKAGAIQLARRTLNGLGLVPRTLAGRARLKRLVFRGMKSLPREIDVSFAPRARMTPLSTGPAPGFKVIYVEATLLTH